MKTMLTVFEVAALLRICPQTVRRLSKRGMMPSPLVFGRQHRWRAADIQAWIEGKKP